MKPQFIYLLTPVEGDKLYIGKTGCPEGYRRIGGSFPNRPGWAIASVAILQTLECCAHGEDSAAERHWIAEYGRENLTNETDGGNGAWAWPIKDSTRAKFKARRATPEKLARMSAAAKAAQASPEYRAKQSAAMKAVMASPEHRENVSRAVKAAWAQRKLKEVSNG